MQKKRVSIILLLSAGLLISVLNACKHGVLGPGDLTGIDTGGVVVPPPLPEHPCDPDSVYFQNDILPLLVSNCAVSGCHDAETHEEGFNMGTYETLMSDADELFEFDDPGDSKIIEVLYEDGDDRMPPFGEGSLTSSEKLMLEEWIAEGGLNNSCDDCDTSAVTYSVTIDAIISSYCLGCHSGSSPSGGIDLSDYDGVSDVAADGSLYGAVSHDPDYTSMPFGGSSLMQCQIDQIRIWVEDGYPDN